MMASHYKSIQLPANSLKNEYNSKSGIIRGRNTHFKVGNSKMNFDTFNTRNYNSKKGHPAKLDPSIEKSLKTHHFEVTDRETATKIGTPMYRTSHPWKLAIPDNY